jgi:hypothetical protein
MQHLEQEAAKSPTGNAPVRSCFAGLAIYRAPIYFTDECQYSVQLPPFTNTSGTISHPLYRYAGHRDKLPCEHVVFHTCLHDAAGRMSRPHFQIAVNPKLVTQWMQNK